MGGWVDGSLSLFKGLISAVQNSILPETQVPLNFLGLKCLDTRSWIVSFLPGNLGPSSAGVIITTAKAISPITDIITYEMKK